MSLFIEAYDNANGFHVLFPRAELFVPPCADQQDQRHFREHEKYASGPHPKPTESESQKQTSISMS